MSSCSPIWGREGGREISLEQGCWTRYFQYSVIDPKQHVLIVVSKVNTNRDIGKITNPNPILTTPKGLHIKGKLWMLLPNSIDSRYFWKWVPQLWSRYPNTTQWAPSGLYIICFLFWGVPKNRFSFELKDPDQRIKNVGKVKVCSALEVKRLREYSYRAWGNWTGSPPGSSGLGHLTRGNSLQQLC